MQCNGHLNQMIVLQILGEISMLSLCFYAQPKNKNKCKVTNIYVLWKETVSFIHEEVLQSDL